MRIPVRALALRSPIGTAWRGKLPRCAALAMLLSLSAAEGVAGADQGPIVTAPAPVVVARQGNSPLEPRPAVPQAPLGIDAQVEAFIRSAPATPWRNDAPLAGQEIKAKRQVHGQVGVAVGTGGYRSAFAQADIPIGEAGMLSVAVSESRSDHAYGGYYGSGGPGSYGALGYGNGGGLRHGARQSLGVSLYLGDSVRPSDCLRRADAVRPPAFGSGWRDDDRCAGARSRRFGRHGTGPAY